MQIGELTILVTSAGNNARGKSRRQCPLRLKADVREGHCEIAPSRAL